jgi:hypothetical protein
MIAMIVFVAELTLGVMQALPWASHYHCLY